VSSNVPLSLSHKEMYKCLCVDVFMCLFVCVCIHECVWHSTCLCHFRTKKYTGVFVWCVCVCVCVCVCLCMHECVSQRVCANIAKRVIEICVCVCVSV